MFRSNDLHSKRHNMQKSWQILFIKNSKALKKKPFDVNAFGKRAIKNFLFPFSSLWSAPGD